MLVMLGEVERRGLLFSQQAGQRWQHEARAGAGARGLWGLAGRKEAESSFVVVFHALGWTASSGLLLRPGWRSEDRVMGTASCLKRRLAIG